MKTNKDYRLTESEAAEHGAEGIIERVVWRMMEDEPDISDADRIEEFFAGLTVPQAAVYSAWHCTNWVTVGGIGHLFESCCAPMIGMTITGFELLHEPRLADCLRQLCQWFPGGVVPRDCESAGDYFNSTFGEEESPYYSKAEPLLEEFEDRPVEEWFDLERFLVSNRENFVVAE